MPARSPSKFDFQSRRFLRNARSRRSFFRPLKVERLETRSLLAVAPLAIRIDSPGTREGLDLDWGIEGQVTEELVPETGSLSQLTTGRLTHFNKLLVAGWGSTEDGDGVVLTEFEMDGSRSTDFNSGVRSRSLFPMSRIFRAKQSCSRRMAKCW